MYVQVLDRLQSALWVFKIRFSSRTGLFLWTGLGRLKYLCFGERNSVAAWCLVSLDFIPPLCEGHLAPVFSNAPSMLADCIQTGGGQYNFCAQNVLHSLLLIQLVLYWGPGFQQGKHWELKPWATPMDRTLLPIVRPGIPQFPHLYNKGVTLKGLFACEMEMVTLSFSVFLLPCYVHHLIVQFLLPPL